MKDQYRHKPPAWTHSDTYGDFERSWRRIFITQLPSYFKPRKAEVMRNKIPTTSSEYGVFYEQDFREGKAEYNINTTFLPQIHLGQGYRRENKMADIPRDEDRRLHLPAIRGIDVQLTTSDAESVTLYTDNSGIRNRSFPAGLSSVLVPKIRDINIKVTSGDGGVYNIAAVPKVRYKWQNYK